MKKYILLLLVPALLIGSLTRGMQNNNHTTLLPSAAAAQVTYVVTDFNEMPARAITHDIILIKVVRNQESQVQNNSVVAQVQHTGDSYDTLFDIKLLKKNPPFQPLDISNRIPFEKKMMQISNDIPEEYIAITLPHEPGKYEIAYTITHTYGEFPTTGRNSKNVIVQEIEVLEPTKHNVHEVHKNGDNGGY